MLPNNRIPRSLWFTLYDALLPFAQGTLNVISAKNPKLRRSLQAKSLRLNGWQIGELDDRKGVLFHASSYGELEAIIPLISMLANNNVRVCLSHSSPSAIKGIDSIQGLWAHGFTPLDYLTNQLELYARLEIDALIITKHDYWPNMLRAARALNLKTLLINGNFHTKSLRSLPLISGFSKHFMAMFDYAWTVSDQDTARAYNYFPNSVKVETMGDCRYDRVRERAIQGSQRFAQLKNCYSGSKVIIGGSTWEPCEIILYDTFNRLRNHSANLKLMIVPHEPTPETIQRNIQKCKSLGLTYSLFSEWNTQPITQNVLIVDKVGVLADLYTVGWCAYVGGGFGKGVHSVIEPAAHSLPVAFGPNYHVSYEAGLLINSQAGHVIHNVNNLYPIWERYLLDDVHYQSVASASNQVVASNEGATTRIFQRLQEMLAF